MGDGVAHEGAVLDVFVEGAFLFRDGGGGLIIGLSVEGPEVVSVDMFGSEFVDFVFVLGLEFGAAEVGVAGGRLRFGGRREVEDSSVEIFML